MKLYTNIASRDFSVKTIRALAKKWVQVVSKTWLPGPDGSFANGETGYLIDDNGTGRMKTFLEVLKIAG